MLCRVHSKFSGDYAWSPILHDEVTHVHRHKPLHVAHEGREALPGAVVAGDKGETQARRDGIGALAAVAPSIGLAGPAA